MIEIKSLFSCCLLASTQPRQDGGGDLGGGGGKWISIPHPAASPGGNKPLCKDDSKDFVLIFGSGAYSLMTS
jgi:hypothetical protein